MQMKIIAGNWKMNGSVSMLQKFYEKLADVKTNNKIIICPPFTLLNMGTNSPKNLDLGAQDCSINENGAFTGDISAAMIAETGAKYVIVGHSERRIYHNETNEMVAKKASIAAANGLIPIICIGETADDKKAGRTLDVINAQIKTSVPAELSDFIIAYEPVWAIGTGIIPTSEEIESVHTHIAALIPAPILYGGSVNSNNAGQIMSIKNVSGVLIGGASLKLDDFLSIIKSTDN
jgi:triosephosphate isomerase